MSEHKGFAAPRTTRPPSQLAVFGEVLRNGLVSAAKGLAVTLKNWVARPRVTVCYPFAELPVSPRWRGRHRILREPDGSPMCIACGACERICPNNCIHLTRKKVTITTPEGEERSVNRPDTMEIDLARCMYCNLCAESCPKSCLHLVCDYAYSMGDTRAMRIDLEGLLREEPLSELELAAKAEGAENRPSGEEGVA